MPYLDVDGKSIYYSGNQNREGVPLLFCHGSGGGHHHWLFQFKAMPPSVNPLAVDLPGHGRSEGKALDDIAAYRKFIRRFSSTLGLEPFILAGHSMGGAVALSYALEYPDDLRGLILIGTGARLRVLPSFLEELKQGRVPEAMAGYLYCPDAPEKLIDQGRKEIQSTDASIYLADLTACDNFDVLGKLSQITVPALIICGSEDSMTPLKYSRYLDENIAQSRLEIIEEAGHMVMLEQAESVNRAIAKFIEEELL